MEEFNQLEGKGNETRSYKNKERKMKEGRRINLIFFNLYSGGWIPIGSTRHCGHQ
jgi:hypothetical protein